MGEIISEALKSIAKEIGLHIIKILTVKGLVGLSLFLNVCIIVSAIIYFFWKHKRYRPGKTILKNEITLTIEDEAGTKAHYERRETFRPEWEITGFTQHGIICAEGGSVENFIVNPGRIVEIFERGGVKHLDIHFDKPFKKGEIITRSLGYDYINCFCSNKEYFLHSISLPEKELNIRIIFPPSRPPKEGLKTYLTKGAIEIKEKDPQKIPRGDGKHEFLWEKKHHWWSSINAGDIYKIEWEW